MSEGLGVGAPPPEVADIPPLDDAYFLDTYGLGPQETAAVVEFGSYTGTVAAMLTDEGCPVGGMVAAAYRTDGIAGVQQRLSLFSQMDNRFSVAVTEKTRGYHEGNVQRDELLNRPDPTEQADFLA